jgi:hypothetical protein
MSLWIAGLVLFVIGILINRLIGEPLIQQLGYVLAIVGIVLIVIGVILLVV